MIDNIFFLEASKFLTKFCWSIISFPVKVESILRPLSFSSLNFFWASSNCPNVVMWVWYLVSKNFTAVSWSLVKFKELSKESFEASCAVVNSFKASIWPFKASFAVSTALLWAIDFSVKCCIAAAATPIATEAIVSIPPILFTVIPNKFMLSLANPISPITAFSLAPTTIRVPINPAVPKATVNATRTSLAIPPDSTRSFILFNMDVKTFKNWTNATLVASAIFNWNSFIEFENWFIT